MTDSTTTSAPAMNIDTNQLVGAIVIGALGLLLLIRLGFRGLVSTV